MEKIGKQYVLTAYGILDDGKLYIKEIQALIDLAAKEGGGVIVVPSGTYLTGALFFKHGVHLYVAQGGMLKICKIHIFGQHIFITVIMSNISTVVFFHPGKK